MKYLSFLGIDNSYCDRISALLDSAETWGSQIVQAYTNAEVHSIKGSPGDIANVGVFSDNEGVIGSELWWSSLDPQQHCDGTDLEKLPGILCF